MGRRLSVIVATSGRPNDLARLIRGLETNDTSDLAELIVVVDGAGVDVLPRGFRTGLPVAIVEQRTAVGAARCRNIGAEQATGDILAFFDDDAIPVPDWVRVVTAAMTGPFRAVTGPVMRFDQGLVARARQARYDRRYSRLVHGQPVRFFAGGNSAIHADLFREIGGFGDGRVGGDNAVVAQLDRVGCTVAFVPEAAILHRNGKGLRAAIANAYGAGRTAADGIGMVAAMSGVFASRSADPGRPDEKALNRALDAAFAMGVAIARLMGKASRAKPSTGR